MLDNLDIQASFEYDYALENMSVPFWKKAKKEVPKPEVCIDEIIEYVEENGLRLTGTFPYALSRFEESKMFSSRFKVVSTNNKHGTFPEDISYKSNSFIVYHPDTNGTESDKVDILLSRIKSYFEKVLTGDITPDKYELNPDEQHILDTISKYIKEYNDKEK